MKRILCIIFFLVADAGIALSQYLRTVERFAGTSIAFEFAAPYSNATLIITGPGDFEARASAKTGAPSLDLQNFGTLADGVYNYQLTASQVTSEGAAAARSALDNGRGSKIIKVMKGVSASGSFSVVGGVIAARNDQETPSRRDRQ